MNQFLIDSLIFVVCLVIIFLGKKMNYYFKKTSLVFLILGIITGVILFISVMENINLRGGYTELFLYILFLVAIAVSYFFNPRNENVLLLNVVFLLLAFPFVKALSFPLSGVKIYETPEILYSDNIKRIQIVECAPGLNNTLCLQKVLINGFFEKPEVIEQFQYNTDYSIHLTKLEENRIRIFGQLDKEKKIDTIL